MCYILLHLIAIVLSVKQFRIISPIKVHLAHESANKIYIYIYLKATFHKKHTVPLELHTLSVLYAFQ